jgi:hypothetical protein
MSRNRGAYRAIEVLLKAVACFWVLGGAIWLLMALFAVSLVAADLVASLFALMCGFGLFAFAEKMVFASGGGGRKTGAQELSTRSTMNQQSQRS